MGCSFTPLTPAEFRVLADRLITVHLAAMAYPEELRHSRRIVWQHAASLPGFQCIVAHQGTEVLGFSFGYPRAPRSAWHREIYRSLARKNPADLELLDSYFEIAEVHVLPHQQNQGIGRRLVTDLCATTTAPRAALSTPEVPWEANRAFGLYRSLGFRDLLRDFLFPGDPRPFAILIAELPLLAGTP